MGLSAKDIAKTLNLSPSAVSIALNNKPGVSDETRRLVLEFAEQHGYSRYIRKQKNSAESFIQFIIYKKHGSIVGDTPFFSRLSEGISGQTGLRGYKLQISYFYESQSFSDQLNTLKNANIEGIILLATEMNPADIKKFRALNIPIVVLDSYFEDEMFDCVVINNVQGAYLATMHLIEKGHRRIGHLCSNVEINNFRERRDGFIRAINKCSELNIESETILIEPTYEGAYLNMTEYLEAHNSILPTAFFADNDIIATSCLRALKDKKYKLPQDISIIGFDDIPVCEMTRPALSTMSVPKKELGILAVDRLVSLITGEAKETVKIEVGTTLIERSSVCDYHEMSLHKVH